MLVARIDVKTTNPLNGSQTVTKVGAMIRRNEHRKQRELAFRLLCFAEMTKGEPSAQIGKARVAIGRIVRARDKRVQYAMEPKEQRLIIVLHRVSPATRPMDSDGLRASLKWIRDGVAAFFGAEDSDRNFEWKYEQRRGRPGEYAVEIEIP